MERNHLSLLIKTRDCASIYSINDRGSVSLKLKGSACHYDERMGWRQRFIGIIISAFMSEIAHDASRPRRPRPQIKPTLYCLFNSAKSLASFEKFRRKTCQSPHLGRTEESSHSENSSNSSVVSQIEQLALPPVPMAKKVYHCRKCIKELVQSEQEQGVCEQCTVLQRVMGSGNFEKFVCFVVQFKTRARESYRPESKLRRIESIQSIQSFTLDRGHESQMRLNFHFIKQSVDILNSVQNNLGHSKRSQIGQAGGGYFCNGCSVQPIVGRRFHCLSCEDYDLCEKCYFYLGHKHDMKSFRDQPEDIANRARMVAIKRSESLKNTLPFLSSSIRDFQQASNLFRTTALRHI